jgi:hypothetical protein
VTSLKELDSRLTTVEIKEAEHWKEAILRIKRLEAILIACAGGVIAMLINLLAK